MRIRLPVLAPTILVLLVLALLVPGGSDSGSGLPSDPGGPGDGDRPAFPPAPNPVNGIVTFSLRGL